MGFLGRFLATFFGVLGFSNKKRGSAFRTRPWRPAFPLHQDFVQGQLSAGTIYRLLRDRDATAAA